MDIERIEKPLFKSDIDQGFTPDEIKKLIDYKLPPPSQILKSHLDGSIDIDDYDKEIGKKLQNLGRKKGQLSRTGKNRNKNKEQIDGLTENIKLFQSTE